MRSEHFPRIFDRLKFLAEDTLHRIALPKSALGKACSYLLKLWDGLVAHARYGHTRIDNNRVENAARPAAIGRKNWLHVGDKDAGDRAAIFYSLMVSARRRGINPFDYMKDLLVRLPKMTNQDDLSVLLPENWRPATA